MLRKGSTDGQQIRQQRLRPFRRDERPKCLDEGRDDERRHRDYQLRLGMVGVSR